MLTWNENNIPRLIKQSQRRLTYMQMQVEQAKPGQGKLIQVYNKFPMPEEEATV